jgi:hypothetical protein
VALASHSDTEAEDEGSGREEEERDEELEEALHEKRWRNGQQVPIRLPPEEAAGAAAGAAAAVKAAEGREQHKCFKRKQLQRELAGLLKSGVRSRRDRVRHKEEEEDGMEEEEEGLEDGTVGEEGDGLEEHNGANVEQQEATSPRAKRHRRQELVGWAFSADPLISNASPSPIHVISHGKTNVDALPSLSEHSNSFGIPFKDHLLMGCEIEW